MKIIKTIFGNSKKIGDSIRKEHIGAFAAQISFFFIMSFFPLSFLVITIIGVSADIRDSLVEFASGIFPYLNAEFVKDIFAAMAHKSASVISVSTCLAAWSAGKCFYALSEAFHFIINTDIEKNYIFLRLRGLFFSLAFVFIITILFFIGVFGKNIHNYFVRIYPLYSSYAYIISALRKIFVVFVLFFILSILYIFLPDWKLYNCKKNTAVSIKRHFLFALLSSIVIYFYTILFSVFADVYIKYNSVYRGVSAFMSVMLWLYGSMYIIILGFKASVKGLLN